MRLGRFGTFGLAVVDRSSYLLGLLAGGGGAAFLFGLLAGGGGAAAAALSVSRPPLVGVVLGFVGGIPKAPTLEALSPK